MLGRGRAPDLVVEEEEGGIMEIMNDSSSYLNSNLLISYSLSPERGRREVFFAKGYLQQRSHLKRSQSIHRNSQSKLRLQSSMLLSILLFLLEPTSRG